MKTNNRALAAYLYQNRMDPPRAFSARIDGVCETIRQGQTAENRKPTGNSGRKPIIPAKRKALLIFLAAVILLLSACAVYALYWSSAQRAREDAVSQMEQPAGELEQAAQSYADAYLSAVTLTAPLSGSAAVGDVSISLHSVDLFEDVDGAEYNFRFSVESDSVGFVTNFDENYMESDRDARERLTRFDRFCELGIDARDFTLTIDGVPYAPYYQPDYEGVPQPAAYWNEKSEEQPYTSSFMVWKNPHPIAEPARMNLSGTLYACDAAGMRTGEIGSFSIDFDYRYPEEQAAAIRQKEIDDYVARNQDKNQARLDALSGLPETATPVGFTQDAFTLMDVTVLEDGLLFGLFTDRQWAEKNHFDLNGRSIPGVTIYLDGYLQRYDIMDELWEVDETLPVDDMGGHPAKSLTVLEKVFYYKPIADMPEVITVYLKRHPHHWYDMDQGKLMTMENPLPLAMAFQVNRVTGEVTLPESEEQKQAWIGQQEFLIADGRNDYRQYTINQAVTVNGVTMLLAFMDWHPDGKIVLWTFFPSITCEIMTWETKPVIAIDGVALSDTAAHTYMQATERPPYVVDIDEWLDTYDVTKKRFGWNEEFKAAPKRITEMPERFTLTFSQDIYDLNEKGERVFIGTFEFTAPLRRDGYTPFHPSDDGFEVGRRKAINREYGVGAG